MFVSMRLHNHHGGGVVAGSIMSASTAPTSSTTTTATAVSSPTTSPATSTTTGVSGLSPSKPSRTEVFPRADGLGGPDPHAAGDADDKGHEDFEHVHLHSRDGVLQGAVIGGQTRPPPGLALPAVKVHPLVKVTADDAGGRNSVQHGEHPDLGHQLLQLANVGSTAAILLEVAADAEERHEAGEDEDGADDEVDDERHQHEAGESHDVLVSHVAHSCQLVPVHPPHGQDHDGLDGRNGPSRQVEIGAQRLDGLLTPLAAGGQEPGQGQDHPPDRRGHPKEVQDEKDDDAPGGLQAFLDQERPAVPALVAGNGLWPRDCPDDEGHRVDGVAHGQKDDRPLRVLEAGGVDDEGPHGDGGGQAAQGRPHDHPHLQAKVTNR